MKDKILLKQIQLLYSHLPITILTGYVAMFFVIFVVGEEINHTEFIYWLIFFNVFMCSRIVNVIAYHQQELTIANLKFWDRLNYTGTIIYGIFWGTFTLFFSANWPLQNQVALWLLVTALMAGASASYSILLRYYLAYVVPIFLLSFVTLALNQYYFIMLVIFIFTVMLSLTAYNFYRKQYEIILNQVILEDANLELANLAVKDPLTGLLNRRAFEDRYQQEWARHIRIKKPLSVLMIDVDYFKNFNDHYGHDEGDRCLVELSRIFRSALHRPGDMLARYGGEEFIILLPETDNIGALEVADRIHSILKSKNILHEYAKHEKRLTVSIGIAIVLPQKNYDPKLIQIIADKELYKAKASGRNCTSIEEYNY